MPGSRFKRLEQRFEKLLWRFRLIAILPVILSLISGGMTFVLGTLEIGNALMRTGALADDSGKSLA